MSQTDRRNEKLYFFIVKNWVKRTTPSANYTNFDRQATQRICELWNILVKYRWTIVVLMTFVLTVTAIGTLLSANKNDVSGAAGLCDCTLTNLYTLAAASWGGRSTFFVTMARSYT